MNAFSSIDKGPLGDLDWTIVDLARADGPRSLNPDGLPARFARFFGIQVTEGLANDKLEALRRFGVRAWYWDLIRTRDLRAFLDAGYSRRDVLEILSRIGMARGFVPTIQEESILDPSRFRSGGPRGGAPHCRCG